MNRVKNYYHLALLAVLAVVFIASFSAVPAHALAGGADIKQGIAGAPGAGLTVGGVIKTVINLLIFLVGAAAVVMIILGGFKYVTSNGDQSSVTSAKNTILYSVIGLVIAVAAYAIVQFVLARLNVK